MSGLVKIITTDIQNPWINLALEEYLLINLKKMRLYYFFGRIKTQ